MFRRKKLLKTCFYKKFQENIQDRLNNMEKKPPKGKKLIQHQALE